MAFVKEYEEMKKKGKGKGVGKNKPTSPYKRGSWRHQYEEEPLHSETRIEQEYYEDS